MTRRERAILNILLRLARKYPADNIPKEFQRQPFLLILATVFDFGINGDRAWQAPIELRRRLGGRLGVNQIINLPMKRLKAVMRKRPALHRFPNLVSKLVKGCAGHIQDQYGGQSKRLFNAPTVADLTRRLLALPGYGPKKSSMLARMAVKDWRLRIKDHRATNVAPDRLVLRVMGRLSLCKPVPKPAMQKAREMYPREPGKLDWPLWWVGREYCRPQKPLCWGHEKTNWKPCPLARSCPKIGINDI